uniref:DUF7507 domain-containing protein n=1 Tax=Aquiflexum sp. TaxID=1872584 RepID=UPI0035940203
FAAPGDELNYTITVTNTGNTTLENISVVDPLTGLNTTITVLAPGASQDINTTYAVNQDDIDAGSVSNTATASVGDISVSDDVLVNATQSPALAISKAVTETTFAAPSDELNYTITVSNTGNVTLENISVVDPLTDLNTNIATLAPGASQDINTTYAVNQDDIDAGFVSNTATASVNDISVSDDVTVTATQSPALAISKAVTETTFAAPGDQLNYTITVTNTGNVTLENISVVDPLTGLNTTISVLAPGVSQDINTTYAVDQDDIDAGSVSNTATASVNDISVSDDVTVTATQSPALAISKAVAETTFAAPGDQLNYTITVSNTGNVTLENISVIDPLTGLNTTITVLAPDASQDINTVYAVNQDDIDAGSVSNTASAAVNDISVSDDATVTAAQSPALSITKTANRTSISAVGDEIIYTLTVRNTGNTTLNGIEVTDPLTGFSETIESLAPDQTWTGNTTYIVTQADLDSGSVKNVASAKVDDLETDDDVDINVEKSSQIAVSKTTLTETYNVISQQIVYTITVINTGNVTLSNVQVSDPLTGLQESISSLSPGQSITFETTYVIQLADLESGAVENRVNVTSTDPDGNAVNGTDTATVGGSRNQIIANDDDLGDYVVTFGGVLGNILTNDLLNGNPVNFEEVNFEFTELAGIIGLLINENGELSLIPGLNPPGEYVLTYELREAANPTNTDDATVTFRLLIDDVDLSITKTSNAVEIFEGDEFVYEILVSNICKTDATNVVITDDLPNAVSYLGSTFEPSDPRMEVDVRVSGAAVTYTVPFFPVGATLLIKIRVRANEINSDRVVQITNIATVSSDENDTNMDDNQASDSNQINPFFIPNVITPDGDGLNDRFEIKGLDKFVENEIVIFNRNGDHVYERTNYQNGWAAEGLVSGTYFFVLKAVDRQGKSHEFKGWIQVIKK